MKNNTVQFSQHNLPLSKNKLQISPQNKLPFSKTKNSHFHNTNSLFEKQSHICIFEVLQSRNERKLTFRTIFLRLHSDERLQSKTPVATHFYVVKLNNLSLGPQIFAKFCMNKNKNKNKLKICFLLYLQSIPENSFPQ